jgi:GDPmannose 4,6-dehydratase
MRKALITGICGQDGSYLAELLLGKGYEVHGLVRRSSSVSTARIASIMEHVKLHEGDMLDGGSLTNIIAEVQPDECYNLAAQSFVPASFTMPDYTGEVTGIGAVRLLESIRQVKRDVRFYQASTSEMFGSTPPPQSESTRFHPRSPYGVAKLYAHHITINYREAYGMFTVNGILFNHEGPRRGELFVSRKIAKAAARIKLGMQDTLALGNLDARRDWGFAGDYVEAMWRMLQQDSGDDYVIATGETHSVREFLEIAFARVNVDWNKHVLIDPKLHRPAEVNVLCGDASKAHKILGWRPTMGFRQLVEHMVDAELSALAAG